MPSDTFMYLTKCSRKVYQRYNWFHHLPNKMLTSIKPSSEDLSKAWDIHIVKRPKYINIIGALICLLRVVTGLVVVYAVKTKDVSDAAAIGSLLVTSLTLLYMAMKIKQWKTE